MTKTQFNIPEAVQYSGLSRTRLYIALKAQELRARKAGRRTLIAVADLDAYLASLPEYGVEA
jgi:excisionase family DNA binding protein